MLGEYNTNCYDDEGCWDMDEKYQDKDEKYQDKDEKNEKGT